MARGLARCTQATLISFFILRASNNHATINTFTMIAIATVCLIASTAANPQAVATGSTAGGLRGYTVTNKPVDFTQHGLGNPGSDDADRKLSILTQGCGERCDFVSYCKSGLTCSVFVFGTGKCHASSGAWGMLGSAPDTSCSASGSG